VINEYIKSRGPLTDIVKQQREMQKDMQEYEKSGHKCLGSVM
jgi:hypothetical protein